MPTVCAPSVRIGPTHSTGAPSPVTAWWLKRSWRRTRTRYALFFLEFSDSVLPLCCLEVFWVLCHVEVHNLWMLAIKSTQTIIFSAPIQLSIPDSKLYSINYKSSLTKKSVSAMIFYEVPCIYHKIWIW